MPSKQSSTPTRRVQAFIGLIDHRVYAFMVAAATLPYEVSFTVEANTHGPILWVVFASDSAHESSRTHEICSLGLRFNLEPREV